MVRYIKYYEIKKQVMSHYKKYNKNEEDFIYKNSATANLTPYNEGRQFISIKEMINKKLDIHKKGIKRFCKTTENSIVVFQFFHQDNIPSNQLILRKTIYTYEFISLDYNYSGENKEKIDFTYSTIENK